MTGCVSSTNTNEVGAPKIIARLALNARFKVVHPINAAAMHIDPRKLHVRHAGGPRTAIEELWKQSLDEKVTRVVARRDTAGLFGRLPRIACSRPLNWFLRLA